MATSAISVPRALVLQYSLFVLRNNSQFSSVAVDQPAFLPSFDAWNCVACQRLRNLASDSEDKGPNMSRTTYAHAEQVEKRVSVGLGLSVATKDLERH